MYSVTEHFMYILSKLGGGWGGGGGGSILQVAGDI